MEVSVSKAELSDPVTLRIPSDVLADIERIAAGIERTRSWVMVRALKLYLAGEGEELLAVLSARAESDADGGHDADLVLKELTDLVGDTKAA